MGKLKTKEDLERMFQESKERNALKRKEKMRYKKKPKLTNITPTMKRAYELARKIQEVKKAKEKQIEAQGGVRKKTDDNVSADTEETSQRVLKQARVWHNPLTEKARNECDLYLTREELQAAEARGEGKINWSKWDELVREYRENIDASVKVLKEKKFDIC